MRQEHELEWDEQAGVSQCGLCGYIRYFSKKPKCGWLRRKEKEGRQRRYSRRKTCT